MFTFHLRPRVMQEGSTCKLLCCLTGNPHPAITWTKVNIIADKMFYQTNKIFPIHHIFFQYSWSALNCNPEWSSYHAGYLICATTVTISVLWSPIQCSAIIILKWNNNDGLSINIYVRL